MNERLHRRWSCVPALCWVLGCGPGIAVMAPQHDTGALDDTSSLSSDSSSTSEAEPDDTGHVVACGPLPAAMSPTWALIVDPDVMHEASWLQTTSSGGALVGGRASLIGLDTAGEVTFVQWHDDAFVPAALAVTPSGDVLVGGSEGDEVVVLGYTELGELLTRVARPLSPAAGAPVDLVIDAAGGALLLSSSDTGAHLDLLGDDLQFGESVALAYELSNAALRLDETGVVLAASVASEAITLVSFDVSGVEAWRTSIPEPEEMILGGFLEVLSATSDALYVIVKPGDILLPEGQPSPRLLVFSDAGGGTPLSDLDVTGRVLAPAPCEGVYLAEVGLPPGGDTHSPRLVHIDRFGSQTAASTLEIPTPPQDYALASVVAIDVSDERTITVLGTFSTGEPGSVLLEWVAAYSLPE